MADTDYLGAATDDNVISEDEISEAILERMMDNVPDDIDKREGSIIYNALAPMAIELTLLYQELDYVLQESFADTAGIDYLIRRAAERGIMHREATNAVVKCRCVPDTVDVTGSRFLLMDSELAYNVLEKLDEGIYSLECETEGLAGNVSSGDLMLDEAGTDDIINALESAEIIGIITPGVEEEDAEALRTRFFESVNAQRFGGNVADYKELMLSIAGVGASKVYPVWDGGGTVKIVFIDRAYGSPDETLVDSVQTVIDPVQNKGEGLGLAPIGHVVTIEGAVSVPVNVTADFTLLEGYDFESVRSNVEAAVNGYLSELRKEWEDGDVVLRPSVMESRLIIISGIIDVQHTTLNGSEENTVLQSNEIPVMGEVANGT